MENEKEAYRVDYGVDKDSQEQKDLELLENIRITVMVRLRTHFQRKNLND